MNKQSLPHSPPVELHQAPSVEIIPDRCQAVGRDPQCAQRAGDDRRMTAADLVVDTLALSEAELLERVASLEADVDSYRSIVILALQHLYDTNRKLDRQVAANQRLRLELRDCQDEPRAASRQTDAVGQADEPVLTI